MKKPINDMPLLFTLRLFCGLKPDNVLASSPPQDAPGKTKNPGLKVEGTYLAKNILLCATSFILYLSFIDRLSCREAHPCIRFIFSVWVSKVLVDVLEYALDAHCIPAIFGGAELTPSCNLWLEISYNDAKSLHSHHAHLCLFLCCLFLLDLHVLTIAN